MSRNAWNEDSGYEWEGPNMSGLVDHTIRRSIRSAKGQRLLRELRAAIAAASGLCEGWCDLEEDEVLDRAEELEGRPVPADVPMCAIGEMARRRDIATYDPALWDADEGHAAGTVGIARAMGFGEYLAREIVDRNDSHHAYRTERLGPFFGPLPDGRFPRLREQRFRYRTTLHMEPQEDRRQRMLRWIDARLISEEADG